MTYSFTTRTLTPSRNPKSGASGHWAARYRDDKRLKSSWAWDIKTGLLPGHPDKPLERARVTITRHSTGRLDEDNLKGGVKGLVDVLKPASKRNPLGMGLIEDDNPDVLALDVRQVRVAKRSEQRVVVVIEPWFPQEAVA